MREIVIISGKGGTGKTSIAASFAGLAGKEIIVADCDVDAANMHLLLQPDFALTGDFYSGKCAFIDPAKCSNCGICNDVCRFNAISFASSNYVVDPLSCEGCGYCAQVCLENAIEMQDRHVGQWVISNIKTGAKMVHARLGIGAENSGKLVTKVKTEAQTLAENNHTEFILVDGSPGIGCPVISSLSGADYVVIVTEPTRSGLHDLKRIYQLLRQFKIPAGCIINKADINTSISEEIIEFMNSKQIDHISSLPYDETFTAAMVKGQTIIEHRKNELTDMLADSWEKIKKFHIEGSIK